MANYFVDRRSIIYLPESLRLGRAVKLRVNIRFDKIPPQMNPLVGRVDEAAAAGLNWVRSALGLIPPLLLLGQLEKLQTRRDDSLEKLLRNPMVHQLH